MKQQQPGSGTAEGRAAQGLPFHPIISFHLNAIKPSPKNCRVNGLLVTAKSPCFPVEMLCNTAVHDFVIPRRRKMMSCVRSVFVFEVVMHRYYYSMSGTTAF